MISVIIPMRDAAATIAEQLEGLSRQTYAGPWELIVVDDASTDASPAIVRAWEARLPRLVVVSHDVSMGANAARNAGARAAQGEFLLFVDADDVVDAGWLEAMARVIPACDAVGGRLEHDRLNPPTTPDRGRPQADGLMQPYGFLPFPIGANCGIRARLLRQHGGFNELDRGGSEADFFWRFQLAGGEVTFVPDAVVYYRFRPTLAGLARQFMGYGVSTQRLVPRFRAQGFRMDPVLRLKRAAWAVTRLPLLLKRDERRRARWVRIVAFEAGLHLTWCKQVLGRWVG